jgi:hypothetical protein
MGKKATTKSANTSDIDVYEEKKIQDAKDNVAQTPLENSGNTEIKIEDKPVYKDDTPNVIDSQEEFDSIGPVEKENTAVAEEKPAEPAQEVKVKETPTQEDLQGATKVASEAGVYTVPTNEQEVKTTNTTLGDAQLKSFSDRETNVQTNLEKVQTTELPKELLDYQTQIDKLYEQSQITEEQLQKERDNIKKSAIIAGVGDAFASLTNLYYTTKGAPVQKLEGALPKVKRQYDDSVGLSASNQRLAMKRADDLGKEGRDRIFEKWKQDNKVYKTTDRQDKSQSKTYDYSKQVQELKNKSALEIAKINDRGATKRAGITSGTKNFPAYYRSLDGSVKEVVMNNKDDYETFNKAIVSSLYNNPNYRKQMSDYLKENYSDRIVEVKKLQPFMDEAEVVDYLIKDDIDINASLAVAFSDKPEAKDYFDKRVGKQREINTVSKTGDKEVIDGVYTPIGKSDIDGSKQYVKDGKWVKYLEEPTWTTIKDEDKVGEEEKMY